MTINSSKNNRDSEHIETVLAVALKYLSHGLSVFPLAYKSKAPRQKWEPYQNDRITEVELRKHLTKARNLAIVAGDISGGLVVRDFDTVEAYEQWKRDHGELAAILPTVATQRGYHVYAKMAPCPRTQNMHDGELRANGGYVVAPPSIHPEGNHYRWLKPFQDVSKLHLVTMADFDLPDRTEDGQKEDRSRRKATEGRQIQKITKAVEWKEKWHPEIMVAVMRSVPKSEGERNDSILKLARRLLTVTEGLPIPLDKHLAIFNAWWEQALPNIATKEKAISMADYFRAIKNAHTPLHDHFEAALEAANQNPKPQWSHGLGENCELCAGLCRELQRVNGDNAFYLSCHKAAKAIGVGDHHHTNKYLNLFVSLGMLKVVEKGTSRKATRYRYVADDL